MSITLSDDWSRDWGWPSWWVVLRVQMSMGSDKDGPAGPPSPTTGPVSDGFPEFPREPLQAASVQENVDPTSGSTATRPDDDADLDASPESSTASAKSQSAFERDPRQQRVSSASLAPSPPSPVGEASGSLRGQGLAGSSAANANIVRGGGMGKRSRDNRGALGANARATRIPKLDTPEEVQRWIEERRRRYPGGAPREEGECESVGGAVAATDGLVNKSNCPQAAPAGNKESDEHPSGQNRARPCKYFLRGRCRHGEQCKYLHVKNETTSHPKGTTKPARQSLLSRLDEEAERLEGVLAVLRFLQGIEYQIGVRDTT